MTARLRSLFLILVVVAAAKVVEQVYRYFAFRDERAMVVVLRNGLLDSGAEVMRTKVLSDSLRAMIETEDAALAEELRVLQRYTREARFGGLPPATYEAYRRDFFRYQEHIAVRNERARGLDSIIARNHSAVDRYNALTAQLQGIAARMGDPYYTAPTPLEAAAERGVLLKRTP